MRAERSYALLTALVLVGVLSVARAPSALAAPDGYEIDNTPAQAKSIVVGAAPQDRTLPTGDIDVATFNVESGKTYAVETLPNGAPTPDTALTLLDTDGATPLGFNYNHSEFTTLSRLFWTADATKKVYVYVEEGEYTGGESYRLAVREATPAISGRVTDEESGLPIDGVQVLLFAGGPMPVASASTDPDGRYCFAQISSGTYTVLFLGYVHEPEHFDDVDWMTPAAATPISYDGSTPVVGIDASLAFMGGDVRRIADTTRYTTAVEIAREGFDPAGTKTWSGGTDVVIASGEDRAAADPLTAAGLCWAYDAPLMLVSASTTPWQVKAAIKEMAAANGPVTVHVVGGPISVPDARIRDIVGAVGSGNVSVHRLLRTGDRYDLSAKIAQLVQAEWVSRYGPGSSPPVALVANGADPTKFFDALALSPIASHKGYPVLLASVDSVPAPTRAALATLDLSKVVIGGGPKTISGKSKALVGSAAGVSPEQWYGNDRYSTAAAIAGKAIGTGWLKAETVGVAARLPDALTGGSMVGHAGGPLIITQGTDIISAAAGRWLSSNNEDIQTCYVLGGPRSIGEWVMMDIEMAVWIGIPPEYWELMGSAEPQASRRAFLTPQGP